MYKKIINGVLVVVVLLFGYYSISPFFRNIEVDDVIPDNFTARNEGEEVVLIPSGFENLSEDEQEDMLIQMKDMNKAPPPIMEDIVNKTTEVNSIEDFVEVVVEETQFPVMGTAGHPVEGSVRVLETSEGTIVRYEDFWTINGPRLHVYLSKDLNANDFIDIGPIKGTKGNINYLVPTDVNVNEYKYVMYWCVPFSVLFNYAEIS